MGCFPDIPFLMTDTKINKHVPLLSLDKKNFCLHDFQQNVLCCLRNESRWQIDLPACVPAQA